MTKAKRSTRVLDKLKDKLSLEHLKQSGDTIVEVLISITVLGLILSVAFVTSRHSLQEGLDATFRDQAESYAQQQVELIKELDSGGNLTNTYMDTQGFCINPSDQSYIAAHSAPCTLPIGTTPASQYTVSDVYDSTGEKYTVTVDWPAANSSIPNSVIVEYKPSNSFSGCLISQVCFTNAPSSGNTTVTSGISFSSNWTGNGGADSPVVPVGYTGLKLNWTTTPIAQSCSGSNAVGNDSSWNGQSFGASGSYNVPSVSGTITYIITCTPFGGGTPTSANIPVTTGTPAPPSISLSSTNVQYGSTVQVTWSAPYATSCTANGPWSAGGQTAGTVGSSQLTSNSAFSVTCNFSGTNISSNIVNVTVGSDGLTGSYYDGANFDIGPNTVVVDPNIDFGDPVRDSAEDTFLQLLENRTGSGYPASCVSVDWSGEVDIPTGGTWTFTATVDDGAILTVNGTQLFYDWGSNSQHNDVASISLPAGWVSIDYQYHNDNGDGCNSDDAYAVAKLSWSGPGQSTAIVPPTSLRP